MADYAGVGASLTLSAANSSFVGFVGHTAGWSYSQNISLVETTGFSDLGNRTYLPTAQNCTGALDGTGITSGNLLPLQGSSPTFTNVIGTLTLYAGGTTVTFTGVVVFSTLSFNRRFDGKLDVGGNWVSTGAISGQ